MSPEAHSRPSQGNPVYSTKSLSLYFFLYSLSVFFSSLSPLSSILYPQLPAVRTIFGYFFIPKSQISSTFICYLCGLIRASAGKCDALAPCRPTCLSLHDGLRLLAFPLDRRSTIGPIGILCTVSSHQDTARSLSQTRPEALFSTVALSRPSLFTRHMVPLVTGDIATWCPIV